MGPDRPVRKAHFLDRIGRGAQRIDQRHPIARSATPQDQIGRPLLENLDIRRSDPGAELDPVDPGGIGDGVLPVADLEAIDVVAVIAGEGVGPGSADEDVGPRVAGEAVVAGLAIERIVFGPADQRVGIPTAIERVVASTAIERVAARRGRAAHCVSGKADVIDRGTNAVGGTKAAERKLVGPGHSGDKQGRRANICTGCDIRSDYRVVPQHFKRPAGRGGPVRVVEPQHHLLARGQTAKLLRDREVAVSA